MSEDDVRMFRRPLLVGLVVVAAAAVPAWAKCVSQWDCTKGSPCERVQTCDSVFETPPIPPSGVATSPQVSPPSPPAVPSQVVPPFGRTACAPAYLCGDDGKCSWTTRCQ